MNVFRPNAPIAAIAAFISIIIMSSILPVAGKDEGMVTLTADTTRWFPDDKVSAVGHVQAVYQDYTITAESADADLQTNIAVFKGAVKLVTQQQTVEGENLIFNMKSKEWSVQNAHSSLTAAELKGNITGEAFIHGASIHGTRDEVSMDSGSLTTCDLEHPHYSFAAHDLEIYPGSRIIAHDVSITALNKHLFTLKSLVIPLKGFRTDLIPQFGTSANEGAFMKAAYPYMATESSQGFLKLDVMQLRGIGTGIDQSYKLGSGSGLGQVSLYYLADKQLGGDDITGHLQHQQKFGSVSLSVSTDYSSHAYQYYPVSASQSWQIGMNESGGHTNTALSFYSNANQGYGTYTSNVTSLRHLQQFSGKLSGMLSMDLRNSESSDVSSADRALESSFELRNRDEKYDLTLVASKRNDLSSDTSTKSKYYSNLDRLPELRFETDSYRLGERLFLGIPSRLTVSAGRYHEDPSGVTSDRLLLGWEMLGRTYGIGEKSDLNLTAGFSQAYYASDMEQYVLRLGGILTSRLNDCLKTRLTYSYQKPDGYSPFKFDYTSKYHYARAAIDYQNTRKLKWSLSTGYDFNGNGYSWQDLALRLTAQPDPQHGFSISTGYDLNSALWRTLIARVKVDLPGRTSFDVGTKYDMAIGKLALARAIFGVNVGKLWKVEGITGWNGTTNAFDYKAFRLTRDLHCIEASLTYEDEPGYTGNGSLQFNIRIKAFGGQDRFGIGQYGQAIDTSMGEYYY